MSDSSTIFDTTASLTERATRADARVAELEKAINVEAEKWKLLYEEESLTRTMLGDILTKTVNALRGQPDSRSTHGWATIPQEVAEVTSRVAELEKERDAAIENAKLYNADMMKVRGQRDAAESVLSMAVARLGGEVEEAPTQRINFLQRIDALREAEARVAELEKERDEVLTLLKDADTIVIPEAYARLNAERARVRELTEALEAINPFVAEDFAEGPDDPGACVTPDYRAAYRLVFAALANTREGGDE